MKERPILMCGAMVKAILDGRKTQTRRIAKPQPFHHAIRGEDGIWYDADCINPGAPIPMKFGAAGDRLWVKETFRIRGGDEYAYQKHQPSVVYRSDVGLTPPDYGVGDTWKPSIFMPRWASRITLEIVAVHIERLQSITEDDAKAEGIEGRFHPKDSDLWTWRDYQNEGRFAYGSMFGPVECYQTLWDSINLKTHPWSSNPWVFVVSFNASLRDSLSPQ